jgi:ParB family chromosome partitioning protein
MSLPNKKDALGKGIRSLLQNIDSDLKTAAGDLKKEVIERSTATSRIPLDQIETNPNQPRKDFDETALSELAASIKMHNIIQPLTVMPVSNCKYRLIAGERRYRSSKIAG